MANPFKAKPYRGRLAPSPTGYLHSGHARTFLIAQRRAQAQGGSLVLRIEDLDRERCLHEYDQALVKDLRWCGLSWQEGPDLGGPFGPYRQTERLAYYRHIWLQLASAGRIYPCRCSRGDVQRAVRAPHPDEEAREPIYPGTCRAKAAWQAEGVHAPMTNHSNWRFRVQDGEAITFTDLRAGPQRFVAGRDFGDFIIWRKDGAPAYQLAVVADDHAMAITEVVRGGDLLRSTAQQILLFRALGWTVPSYYHCPLMMDEYGNRLAKRAKSQSLRALRESDGLPPVLEPTEI